MRNFFAGLFLLLGVGCLGVAGFSAYQDRVISPQVSSASSPVLFSQVSDISSYWVMQDFAVLPHLCAALRNMVLKEM